MTPHEDSPGRDAGKPGVFFVSKPLAPPWNDSGKNLPWSVASRLREHQAHVLIPRRYTPPEEAGVVPHRLLGMGRAYRNAMTTNLQVLAKTLAAGSSTDILHFFFTPTPLTARAGKIIRGFKRKKAVIQSLNSLPAFPELLPKLLFGDKVVVVSAYTAQFLEGQGLDNVVHLPPCVEPIDRATLAPERYAGERPLVVYAGDLEFSRGALSVAEAIPHVLKQTEVDFVFACRQKTARAQVVEQTTREILRSQRLPPDHVRFLGEVEDMPSLLAATSVLLLPVDTLFAKMDIPLVVLEAMQLGVPVILGNAPPLLELIETGATPTVNPEDPLGLAALIVRLLKDEAMAYELSEMGKALYHARYSPDRVVPRYEELYHSLL
jgi:glycosyltransferase involved in cell wall biosynthesis